MVAKCQHAVNKLMVLVVYLIVNMHAGRDQNVYQKSKRDCQPCRWVGVLCDCVLAFGKGREAECLEGIELVFTHCRLAMEAELVAPQTEAKVFLHECTYA